MWHLPEWLLVGWTAVAAGWWLIALILVTRRLPREKQSPPPDLTHDLPAETTQPPHPNPLPASGARGSLPFGSPPPARGERPAPIRSATGAGSVSLQLHRFGSVGSGEAAPPQLTIFKPLPPLRNGDFNRLSAALETFVGQLDVDAEMLLGIEIQDRDQWSVVIDRWRAQYPHATIREFYRPKPTGLTSPKVSWHRILSEHARADRWLWSDADIIAPADFLRTASRELDEAGAGLVTCGYVIRDVPATPMLFEAVFVNVEFFPGVLACDQARRVKFAFGAAMLFRAADFHARVGWEKVARMAEDYVMGEALSPVTLSRVQLETLASETRWTDAMLHYLRWQKTVRWNRPLGFAAQIIITPAIGWIICGCWWGALATICLESLVAWRLCRSVGCRLAARHVIALPAWSLLRALGWVLCWFPWPVVFRSQNQVWWNLKKTKTAAEK